VVVQSQAYGPEGVVRAFFAAVESGNSGRAASLIDIGSPTTKTDAVMLGSAAFGAALHAEKQAFPGLHVGPAVIAQSDLALVPISYSGKRFSIDLRRESGFYLGS